MDSGGSPSVVVVNDDSTKPIPSSSSFPTPQIQPAPIAVMMQQAIAMQQFQFQQALLMQQVMASQQAATRAATLKSAAEMAAARAAEISKQLRGSDVEEENEKAVDRSANRSKSRSSSLSNSRSRSGSKSKSRSRSRSPIRYRRDRSLSGSPIRYRRDRYSPSRYRDNYGYRSRSRSRYRGYYRGGRGDSSWNYYRREWDRDRGRDYLSYGHRRSRSRSRARRRSRTRSRSPRYRRGGSLSPRHRREDRLTSHRSRRSRSKEAKRSLSRSKSSSRSREGGRVKKENTTVIKGSLSPKPKSGDDSDLQEVHSDSIDNDRSLRRKSPRHSSRTERREKIKSIGHKEVKDSPLRSLSVSPELSLRKIGKEHTDEDINSSRHNRKLSGQRKRDDVGIEAHQSKPSLEEQVPSGVQHGPNVVNSDGWTLDINGSRSEDMSLNLSKEYQRELPGLLEKGKRIGQIGKLKSSEDEIDDGKELDDWRDDIKAYEKEKAMRKESRKVAAKKEDKLTAQVALLDTKDRKENCFQQHTNNSSDEINQSGKELDQMTFSDIEVIQDIHYDDVNIRSLSDVEKSSYEKSYVVEDVVDRDINHVWHPGFQSIDRKGKIGEGDVEENVDLSYHSDGGGKVHSHDSTYEDRDGDLIYEGPVVAVNECVYNQQPKSQSEHVKKKEDTDMEYKVDKVHNQPSTGQVRTSGDREHFEEQFKRFKETLHDEHVSHKRRGRERSAAKEELKRDDGEFEKRKDRHKKHRRKHKHQNSMEQDDDEDDGDDSAVEGEGRRGKKRHTRKHRRDDEERRERRKKRHKDRVKAGSCSPSQSLANDEKDNVETDVMTAYRKGSSRHKRRRKETSKSLSPSYNSGT